MGGGKLFYDEDGIQIWVGDCREIEAWREADVLVTDPPYGMAYKTGHRPTSHIRGERIAGDDDAELRDDCLELWGDKPALVFGTWRVPRPPTCRQLLIWDKGDSPGMGDLTLPWGPGHEEIYVLGEGFNGRRKSNVIRYQMLGAQDRDRPDHPTPKPISLMIDLIGYCPPGVIADPFMGSGSTLRAAKDLGRQAIGVEIDERHCETTIARLAQGVLPL